MTSPREIGFSCQFNFVERRMSRLHYYRTMSRKACYRALPPSLPRVHLAVKEAMDAIAEVFAACYREQLPDLWKEKIEKQVWKNLMLTQHEKTRHPSTCKGGLEHHAWVFARRALRKLLADGEDDRFAYYIFHFFVWDRYECSFDSDCQHYV